MEYARVYKNIKPKAIKLSRELIPKMWSEPLTHKKMYAIKWLIGMSKLYGIRCPRLIFVKDPLTSGGSNDRRFHGIYSPGDHSIVLYRNYSFVTLAHEFRHAVQYKTNCKLYKDDLEEDALAWSLSLFKKSFPKSYKKAKDNNKIRLTS